MELHDMPKDWRITALITPLIAPMLSLGFSILTNTGLIWLMKLKQELGNMKLDRRWWTTTVLIAQLVKQRIYFHQVDWVVYIMLLALWCWLSMLQSWCNLQQLSVRLVELLALERLDSPWSKGFCMATPHLAAAPTCEAVEFRLGQDQPCRLH